MTIVPCPVQIMWLGRKIEICTGPQGRYTTPTRYRGSSFRAYRRHARLLLGLSRKDLPYDCFGIAFSILLHFACGMQKGPGLGQERAEAKDSVG